MHPNVTLDTHAVFFERISELRKPLVNYFYSSCGYRVKCGQLDQVYTLQYGGEIIAAARFVPQKSGHYLLRNLCVTQSMRKQGLATQLLLKALAEISGPANCGNCYCFALPHLKEFYSSLGFNYFSPETVPEDIAEMHLRNQSRNRDWILMGYIIG